MKNTTISPNGTTIVYDIDLCKDYVVEYALNVNVLQKFRSVEETILNYSRNYTEHEIELVAQSNAKRQHRPCVVLNDNSKMLVLEFDFFENHWILLNGAKSFKKLKELELDFDTREEINDSPIRKNI
jgi:hypothetical protein